MRSWLWKTNKQKFSYPQNRQECDFKKWLTLLKHCKNQGWCYHQKGCKLPLQFFHIHKIGMSMAHGSKKWLTTPSPCLIETLQKSRLVLPSKRLCITATKFSYPQNRHGCDFKKWLTMPPPCLIETLQKSRLVLPSKRLQITATKFSYPQNRHKCGSKKWPTVKKVEITSKQN